MALPWKTVDRVAGAEGILELRRRGQRDFLIVLDGRVLMQSRAHRSETVLARLACEPLSDRARARVLVGGLGMAYTLRAALDCLAEDAHVEVAEIEPVVVRWCRGPLATLTSRAVEDPRVELATGDVAASIAAASRRSRAPFDAIVLDLSLGPARDADDHPHYGGRALATTRRALTPEGVLAVWAEDPDPSFERRLTAAGFDFERTRPGRGGRRHAVYCARSRAARGREAAG